MAYTMQTPTTLGGFGTFGVDGTNTLDTGASGTGVTESQSVVTDMASVSDTMPEQMSVSSTSGTRMLWSSRPVWLDTVWSVASSVSAAACAYHGYKRNKSVGWAIGWALLGGMFPVITPMVALGQGFGKPRES